MDGWAGEVRRFYGSAATLSALDRRYDCFVRAYGVVGDILELSPGDRLLDVGCGSGTLARALSRRVKCYHGIDSCPEVLELARRHNPASRFSAVDVLDYRSRQCYDCAAALSVLEFCRDKPQALASIHRALRPDGRLYLEVRNADCPLPGLAGPAREFLQRCGLIAAREINAENFGDLPLEDWLRLLDAAGFTVQRLRRSVRPWRYGTARTLAKNGLIALTARCLPVRRHYMVGILCTRR